MTHYGKPTMNDLARRLLCWIKGHRFTLIRQLSFTSRKLQCRRCERYFAMNDDVRVVVPWDHDFETLYRDLERFNRENNLEIPAQPRR